MVRIAIQFLAGRYHATPWGRHVNEGDIEWPPSPWRLYRALIATGFSKLGWQDVPDSARSALEVMAGVAPVFHLPPATAAHTRHYMPAYRDSTDRVIDSFAYVGRHARLVIEWGIELPPEQAELIDQLFRCMSYLGRAESWIEAQRIERIPDGLTRCDAAESPPGPTFERISLLAPLPAGDYAQWRDHAYDNEVTRRFQKKRREAEQKSRKPPRALTKKELAKLTAELPETFVDALRVDTPTLQKAGWSQPPGTRWLHYWRPQDALTAPRMRLRRCSRASVVDTALLAFSPATKRGKALPHLHDALWRCEQLHQALVSLSEKSAEDGQPSASLIGHQRGQLMQGHRHATLFPLQLKTDSTRIDHILVHAPMGFEPAALAALQRVQRLYTKKALPDLFVSLVGLGQRADFRDRVPIVASSCRWVSYMPFVPPRYLKQNGRNALAGQVVSELESRGLAAPQVIEFEIHDGTFISVEQFWSLWRQRVSSISIGAAPTRGQANRISSLSPRWRHFRRSRRKRDRQPPNPSGFGLRLTFAQPVTGPFSLGYASHYGLGAFMPA